MEIGIQGLNVIKKYEGLKLKAYKCPAGIPTIGYGATFYANKQFVKMGDVITKEQAEELLIALVNQFVIKVNELVKGINLKQNQFDALVSFAYNVGPANLAKSTLLKKVKANPNDESIEDEFAKWNKASGQVLEGLTKRRAEEAKLYFS